jgi:hypothetical protein
VRTCPFWRKTIRCESPVFKKMSAAAESWFMPDNILVSGSNFARPGRPVGGEPGHHRRQVLQSQTGECDSQSEVWKNSLQLFFVFRIIRPLLVTNIKRYGRTLCNYFFVFRITRPLLVTSKLKMLLLEMLCIPE